MQRSSSVKLGITGYYYLSRSQHVGSQGTDLSCFVQISTFCFTTSSQAANVTLQTDGGTSCS